MLSEQEKKAIAAEVRSHEDRRGAATEALLIVQRRRGWVSAEVITDVARKKNIDLIVLGSHGRTGLKRLLMGSVTESVIAHAPCPVLVVKL